MDVDKLRNDSFFFFFFEKLLLVVLKVKKLEDHVKQKT